MDNNMINIDELFRQRMGNAEEEQRPGSWLKMKELLDEQMPVREPVAGSNRRRMLFLTAGILLVSTLTVGSYQAYEAFRGNNISEDVLSSYTAHGSSNGTRGAVSTVMNYADGKTVVARNGQVQDVAVGSSDEQNAVSTSDHSNSNDPAQTSTNNTVGQNNVSDNTPTVAGTNGNNSTFNNNTNDPDNSIVNNNLPAVTSSNGSDGQVVPDKNNGNKNTVAQNNSRKQISGSDLDAQMTDVTDNIQNIYNSGSKAQAGRKTINTTQLNTIDKNTLSNDGTQNNSLGQNTLALNSGNNKPNTNVEPVLPNKEGQGNVADNTKPADQFITDSMKKIEMRQHVSADGKVIMDTFGKGLVPVRKKVDNTDAQDMLASNVDDNRSDADKDNVTIPNATDLQMTTEDGNGVYKPLVPNSAAKDSAPKTAKAKKNYYDNNRFDEMVKNAKMKLRGVKFYPGVVAGANMSMAKKGLNGFQLGLKGDLSFGRHWSVMSELKYMQRFNGGNDLRDDYNTGLDSFITQSGVKAYTYDSVEHFFNFTNVSTIEMPIALKYNVKRFNVFGGVNLNYNLAVNNDEVERPYQITKTETSLSTGKLDYSLLNGKPNISSADFSSRFSVGYLFGMSYELSPAMQVDLRLTQPVWDNAKTSGAKAVSKELYNAPTLQFNMSYRFSQKPYKKFRK